MFLQLYTDVCEDIVNNNLFFISYSYSFCIQRLDREKKQTRKKGEKKKEERKKKERKKKGKYVVLLLHSLTRH